MGLFEYVRIMASINKQKDWSKYWIAQFLRPDGRWVSSTTKQTDRGAAQRLAFEWDGVAVTAAEWSPAGAAVGRITRQIIERVTRCKIESVSITDFLHQWVSRMEATRAPRTACRYGERGGAFLAYLGPDVQQVADAQFNLGVLHSTTGEIDTAITNFTFAIATPDVPAKISAKALVNRGLLFQKEGKTKEAMADFNRVLKLPDVPEEYSEKAKKFLSDDKQQQ